MALLLLTFARRSHGANADFGEIDASVIGTPGKVLGFVGARGIGEIGITCSGPAIPKAVLHAIGKRERDLPITLDKFS
jgi:xanthine dehydrogenase YagR molybdenum-binding subunit